MIDSWAAISGGARRNSISKDQALTLFRQDAKAAPGSPGQPYFLVGALDLYLGNQAGGLRNLHRALELDPGMASAKEGLAKLGLAR